MLLLNRFLYTCLCLLKITHKLGATAPSNSIGFFTSTREGSFLKSLSAKFATLSQFEKEEDDAKGSFWVEDKYDDQDLKGLFDSGDSESDDFDEESFESMSQKTGLETSPDKSHNDANHDVHEEHPMRTDEWLVEVRLSPFLFLPGSIRREASLLPQSYNDHKNMRRRKQLMKFGRDGFVLLLEEKGEKGVSSGESTNGEMNGKHVVTSIGKWHMSANGISWTMPTCLSKQNDKSETNTLLHFHADLHLSKFQNKPRMFKGTITRDRFATKLSLDQDVVESNKIARKMFRPVIASFTAVGTGEDTLVLQYKDRGFGLSGGNG